MTTAASTFIRRFTIRNYKSIAACRVESALRDVESERQLRLFDADGTD